MYTIDPTCSGAIIETLDSYRFVKYVRELSPHSAPYVYIYTYLYIVLYIHVYRYTYINIQPIAFGV